MKPFILLLLLRNSCRNRFAARQNFVEGTTRHCEVLWSFMKHYEMIRSVLKSNEALQNILNCYEAVRGTIISYEGLWRVMKHCKVLWSLINCNKARELKGVMKLVRGILKCYGMKFSEALWEVMKFYGVLWVVMKHYKCFEMF